MIVKDIEKILRIRRLFGFITLINKCLNQLFFAADDDS